MIRQLNIFLENRPGRLQAVSKKLQENKIDIRAFTLQDRGEFGLIKLLVNKPQEAYLAMADLGFACALKDVLALSIPDQPGNLHILMAALAENNINVIDAYGFVLQPQNQGICCLEIKDIKNTNAEQIVTSIGFKVLTDEQVYTL
jgi:hypothetical protein